MSCSRKLYRGADPGFLDSGFKFTEGEFDLLIVADYLLFFLVFLKILHENAIVLSQRGFERTPSGSTTAIKGKYDFKIITPSKQITL